MKKITIEVIPHEQQRYETVGDWSFSPEGELIIRVSDLGNWKLNFLVALHELIEVVLCTDHGISQKDVDDFDIIFEKNRQEGDESEPGDQMTAPYWQEHQTASGFERLLAALFGVNWQEYERRVQEL